MWDPSLGNTGVQWESGHAAVLITHFCRSSSAQFSRTLLPPDSADRQQLGLPGVSTSQLFLPT